jgi:predicted nucleotide-binding protein
MSSESANIEHADLLPRVFIGSSSAALELANRVQRALGDQVNAIVWNQDVFTLGEDLLDSLLRYVSVFDFAIFVMSADDVTLRGRRIFSQPWTRLKGRRSDSPRDNVIFELGLFMGVRGRTRAFVIIVPRQGRSLRLPTDLAGNISLILDPNELGDDTYLASKIAIIRQLIEKRAKEAALSLLPSAGLAYGYYNNFLLPVGKNLSGLKEVTVSDRSVDISGGNYDFWIVVPDSLSDAGVEGRNVYVQRRGLLSFKLTQPPRGYDLFVHPEPQNGRVQFVDYPTTLRASRDVIHLAVPQNALGQHADIRERMEEREISNFVKALTFLLREPEAAGLRSHVEIRYVKL